jgi:hypothetical protein
MTRELTSNVMSSTKTLTQTKAATATRNINTFEVLDFDSHDESYAVIYKKIHIEHTQVYNYADACDPFVSDSMYCQPDYTSQYTIPMVHHITSGFTSIASRSVTYKLAYKIKNPVTGAFVTGSIDLATCNVSASEITQTASGQRIYGVSIQITDEFICYAFEIDTIDVAKVIDVDPADRYDGPVNVEDLNFDHANAEIWTRRGHVVGLVNINDGVGSIVGYNYSKEYDILNKQQYSVGVVKK